MHESGSGTSPTPSLQRACGVCGVYGLETLYASHAASVGSKDVQLGAGALMEYIKWGLVDSGAGGSKIDPALEVAGTEALLGLASSIFLKADAYEKTLISARALAVDDRWKRLRGLYFSAWEFFGVVAWMREKGKLPVEEGLGEKRRYAMWRSTEIWKAQKDDRMVDVRGIDTSMDTNPAPGSDNKTVAENKGEHVMYYNKQTGEHVDAIITAIDRTVNPHSFTVDLYSNGLDKPVTCVGRETESSRLSNTVLKGRQPSPPAASSPPNREDLRPTRSFKVGDDIWYSQVLRGCSRVKARVVRVGWDDAKGGLVYDIAQKGGVVQRNVRPETCAPILEHGDCLVFGDEGGFDSAIIEEVYHDHWPPRYMCLVNGGLMELEDEYLYFDEGEEVVLSSSSDDESEEAVVNSAPEAEGEADGVPQPEASGGEPVEEPSEGPVDAPVEGMVDENAEVPAKKIEQTNKISKEPEKPAPVKEVQRTTAKLPTAATTRTTPQATLASSPMNDDIVSMTKAEKLCKSAISCMSFGDAPAAVRFLQEALDTLTGPNA